MPRNKNKWLHLQLKRSITFVHLIIYINRANRLQTFDRVQISLSTEENYSTLKLEQINLLRGIFWRAPYRK